MQNRKTNLFLDCGRLRVIAFDLRFYARVLRVPISTHICKTEKMFGLPFLPLTACKEVS